MRGLVTNREVITNARLIVREFGPRCFLRCLVAMVRGKTTTFLTVATR